MKSLCAPLAMAFAISNSVAAQQEGATMGSPELRTSLSLSGVFVVHPASEAGRRQAEHVAQAVTNLGGRAAVLPADQALDESGLRLRADTAAASHILLGDINTNRAMLGYYADLLDFSDAYHPGGDGYVLRSIPRGSGAGGDALIVGASSETGLSRAVNRLLQLLDGLEEASVPYVFEAQLDGEAARSVPVGSYSAPYDADRWAGRDYSDMAIHPAYVYALTATEPAAEVAVAGLLKGAEEHGWYPVSDYTLEWLTRAWSYVRDAPCVSEQDAAAIDNALLRTLYEDQNEYWRARDGRRIGGRHQTMGTSAFYAGVRLLLRRGAPDDAARAQLEEWRAQCEEYLANAAQTFHDDLEGIPCYHSFQPISNEALRSGVTAYFGENLDWAVHRALAVTDNLGYYAGTGTYEEARPGTTRVPIMLGYPLAMAAYLRGDPRHEWLLRNFPGTSRGTWGLCVGYGARGFARPAAVPVQEPTNLLGLLTVPLGPYREQRLPQRAEGSPPREGELFEKLCLRDSLEPAGQYLVLQGYQGTSADNLPPRDGNSIIRYTDLGHIWLYANSERAGNFHRNAVHVSDGLTEAAGEPTCELLLSRDAGPVALVASRLRDYAGCDWTRHVIWRKSRYFVVIDLLAKTQDGSQTAICSFRTPCAAEATTTGMRAWEGNAEMVVANADGLSPALQRWTDLEGAAIPTFLRQVQPLGGDIGSYTAFRNLVYAADPGRPMRLDARPAGAHALMVRGETPEGDEIALIGVSPAGEKVEIGPFETSARVFHVSPAAAVSDGAPILLGGEALSEEGDAARLRETLADLWTSLPEAAQATKPESRLVAAERLFRFDGLTPRAEPILGPDIRANPQPNQGTVFDLIDGTVPLWQAVSFPGDQDVSLTLDLRRAEPLESVEIATGLVTGTNVVPDPDAVPPPREAVVRLDEGEPATVQFACGFTYEPLHKGVVCAMGRWRADLAGVAGREIDLTLPKDAWPGGSGIREIIVRRGGTNDTGPLFARQADVNGDGETELVLGADSGEICCLSVGGRLLWRHMLPGPVTALECIDLADGQPPAILAATREARLYRLAQTGDIAWTADFIRMAGENGDLPTAYSIGTWRNRDGEREIVCGNYNACSFVSADGSRVEYCRAGGAFETMMLPEATDLTGDGVEDQLLLNVWGGASIIDGAQRTMTGGRSVPRGEGLCFEWWRQDPDESLLLVGAENGVGLLNAKTGEYVWRHDLSPVSGCAIGSFGGDLGRVAVVGKREGFVLAYSESGELSRRIRVDGLVEGLAAVSVGADEDRLVALTDDRLIMFAADLNSYVAIAEGTGTQLVALSEPGTFAVLRPQAAVDVYRLPDHGQ